MCDVNLQLGAPQVHTEAWLRMEAQMEPQDGGTHWGTRAHWGVVTHAYPGSW